MNNWWYVSIAVLLLAVGGIIFKFGKWTGEVNSDRDRFNKFIKEVRDDIKTILSRIPPSVVVGSSPLRLTELGEKISKEIHAKEWAKEIANDLIESVKDKQPYEIQETCIQYIDDDFDPDDDLNIKLNASAYENGVPKEQLMKVLAIELRDRLLELIGS